MKVYTRTGDDGETGLLGGDRIEKTSRRITAIGEVDELNAALGLARAEGAEALDQTLATVQNLLFDLGAELACPPGGKFALENIQEAHVAHLESSIDTLTAALPPLKNFILPGGTRLGACLHLARAVCRRAERAILLLHEFEPVRAPSLHFMNRLSDWLFVAARTANASENVPDVPWRKTELT